MNPKHTQIFSTDFSVIVKQCCINRLFKREMLQKARKGVECVPLKTLERCNRF